MSKMHEADQYPIVEEIKAGWAAIGEGWAVHAPTKEEVIEKYREREKYYEWLDRQPFVYENTDSGNSRTRDSHE